MTPAERYKAHRERSDKAFKAGNGALSTGHASMAHIALMEYAKEKGISTDNAAAMIRRGEP
jgi:hypothetical protein